MKVPNNKKKCFKLLFYMQINGNNRASIIIFQSLVYIE